MAAPMQVDGIDEDLHSRQLAVYGRESMKRMSQASVLIMGLKGLGCEVAKNVILAGVKAVVLHDPSPVELRDLSSQFYLSPDDVGAPTSDACQARLQELNVAVAVTSKSSEISMDELSQFQAVVCTNMGLAQAQRIDAFCAAHSPPIPFVYGNTRGVFAQVFCDFGPSFTVFDVDGEPPHTGIVASVTQGCPTIVTCVDDERLEFEEGDLVTFSEVVGMTQLNDGVPRRVKIAKPHFFELDCDSTGYSQHERGGIVTQFKSAKQLSHRSLAAAVAEPGEFLLSDFSKIERSHMLHIAFQGLEAFQVAKGRLPAPGNREDIAEFIAAVKQINDSLAKEQRAELDDKVLANMASTATGEISPMCAMFGGIVGQEVVKAISGKFTPLQQWFYFDSEESLPNEILPEAEYKAEGSRYDGQIAVFGRAVHESLTQLNTFLVGAGALGCEFLKNLALMGVATGERGLVTVTDDDIIEKSNLSRQFLFRDWNIGDAKSTVAGAAAMAINPAFKTNLLQNRVSPETEPHFPDSFWEGLDLVVNALDNVNARLYVDSRCVYFQKPLLESGTLGAKCNTQMVLPNMTENYGASRDPAEKSAPMCTLHSFPHNIDHCLTWARSEFEGALEKIPQEVNVYLADPAAYLAASKKAGDTTARTNLENVLTALQHDHCTTFLECLTVARKRAQEFFFNRIAQLTYTFPEDATTSSGAPFWSAPKRFPSPVAFSASDPSYAAFLRAFAILLAELYGVVTDEWVHSAEKVAEAAAQIELEAFVPRDGVKIETDPKADSDAAVPMADDEDTKIAALEAQLKAAHVKLAPGFRLAPITFEKDDDTNYHMDLITGLANMRARNYQIPEVEQFQAKLIAGRIIPAIATATALATGLVCLELYKVVQNKPVEDYRNTFANLALPLFAMAEPLPMKSLAFNGMKWSLWDRWTLEGNPSVQEVLDWFSEKKLEAYSISYGPALLYNNIFPKHKERLGTAMSSLVKSVGKVDLPDWRSHFDVVVACEDADGEDIDVPLISVKFR